jgi:hypothetical protein
MSDSVECNRVNQHHPQRMIERVIIQGEKNQGAGKPLAHYNRCSWRATSRASLRLFTLSLR